jgi:hypothetical protein
MRTSTASRMPSESSDAVGLIIALLVRYPELATIVSHPAEGTLTLSFAIGAPLGRAAVLEVREAVGEHVRSLLGLSSETHDALAVDCESDGGTTFLRITRDVRTFSREELQLLVALLAQRYGDKLYRSPAADDDGYDDEGAADELVDYAIEALRDPESQRSLVGFREEKRVLVYFVKSRKKAKARARS